LFQPLRQFAPGLKSEKLKAVSRPRLLSSCRVTPYLSICTCLGYDAPYLVEWLEFHRLVGVEKFFLYNNGDREGQRRLLRPYVADGTVVLHEWPDTPPQRSASKHCLEKHRGESRWIAFIDSDEYLFSPTGRALPDVLADYEAWPVVGYCRAFLGPSVHLTRPPGLVDDRYLQRLSDHRGTIWVKSIVDPVKALRPLNPHCFAYESGFAVDENFRPLDRESAASVSFERLRINHYWTKSEQEALEKFARPRPDDGKPYPEKRTIEHLRSLEERMGERDETILRYVPALRKAVDEANRRQRSARESRESELPAASASAT
jgi:hypothetical protein